MPVFVAQVAMPQILDSRAAEFAEPRKHRGVRADPDQKICPGAGACQWGAQMGCTEENKMIQSLRPGVTGKHCVVTRAPCHETAVTDDNQLFDRVRPITQKHFHYVSKFTAVAGD